MKFKIYKEGVLSVLLIVVILAGAAIAAYSIKEVPRLFDADEAAWAFNGYYFELISKGDLKNPAWNEFDKYANHPPATAYLFGAMHRLIDKPIKSIEPRKYWFENDMMIVTDINGFVDGLMKRLDYQQIRYGRYMSAFFGWLCAIVFLFLAMRLTGVVGAIVSFFLFALHPTFRGIETLAVGDTFIMFLALLSVYLSVVIGERGGVFYKRNWHLLFVLMVVLGISFASKISAYALIPPVVVMAIFLGDSKRAITKNLLSLFCVFIMAFFISILLDPGMYDSPIKTLFERFAWRMDRIEIQRFVYADQYFKTIYRRVAFIIYYLFLSKPQSLVFLATFIIGFSSFFSRWDLKGRLVFFLTVYFGLLTVFFTPMAWSRYVVMFLPFLMLMSAVGVEWIYLLMKDRSMELGVQRRRLIRISVLTLLLIFTLRYTYYSTSAHMPERVIDREWMYGLIYAKSMTNPGVNPKLHIELANYFKETGRDRWATEQIEIVETAKGRKNR